MRDLKSYEPFFGKWYIERPIYENEIGGIYEIRNPETPDEVQALKVIRMPDPGIDPEGNYAEKLEVDYVAEISMMQALKEHINVTSYEEYAVLARGDEPGWDIVIRMEMVTPVPEYIRSNPFTIGDAVLLGCDVCAMLEFCHPHDIVHRNICPQNIFVSADGIFKVGDFAIEDPNGQLLSTLTDLDAACYMAPEVYYGEDPVPASDIYSLGMLLYGLLNNNRLPFQPAYPEPCALSDTVLANDKRFHGEAFEAPANAGEKLSAIILKACSYKIEDRYASAAEMKAALNEVLYAKEEEDPDSVAAKAAAVVAAAEAAEQPESSNVYVPEQTVQVVEKKTDKRSLVLAIIAVIAVLVLSALGVRYFLDDEPVVLPGENSSDTSDLSDVSDASDTSEEVSEEEPTTAAQTEVPSLTGMSYEDAELLLKSMNFRVLRKTTHSDTMAEGFVCAQTPVAKTMAKTGSVVTITVSLGASEAPVTGITLSQTNLTVAVGQSMKLTAALVPADAAGVQLSWSSSVPAIAQVDINGLVTGRAVGTAIVTVSTPDGAQTATCTVAVVAESSVTVSNQVGKSKAAAEAAFKALGLNVKVTEQNSSTVAKDTVMSQSLTPGSSAKKGDTITIVVSKGPQTSQNTPDNNNTVSVTGVTLSKKTLALEVGKTGTLTATIAPANASNKNYSWSTSDAKVATVSAGVVTAKSVGTAVITATTVDGNKTAKCTVTVTAAKVAVTGVTLSRTTLSMDKGTTATLTATVAPSNASNKNVTWASSNTAVVSVSNGKLTAKSAGTATVTVSTADGNKKASCTVTVVDNTAKVPDVKGKTLEQAESALKNAGFKVSVSYDYSGSAANNTVVSQFPAAGSIVEKGNATTIYITVNRVYVNITVLAEEGGTVSGSGLYYEGEKVTIKATPKAGYTFAGWSDGNTDAERTVTVGKTSSVFTAKFTLTPAEETPSDEAAG